MDCLLERIKVYTTKLWRLEIVVGFQPQQLRENVCLAPTLRRETKCFLKVG